MTTNPVKKLERTDSSTINPNMSNNPKVLPRTDTATIDPEMDK